MVSVDDARTRAGKGIQRQRADERRAFRNRLLREVGHRVAEGVREALRVAKPEDGDLLARPVGGLQLRDARRRPVVLRIAAAPGGRAEDDQFGVECVRAGGCDVDGRRAEVGGDALGDRLGHAGRAAVDDVYLVHVRVSPFLLFVRVLDASYRAVRKLGVMA